MSITFTKAYVANGKTFATLAEAQKEGIVSILDNKNLSDVEFAFLEVVAMRVLQTKEAIVEVLTMKETSRPKARGAKKPRKNRVTEPVQTTSA